MSITPDDRPQKEQLMDPTAPEAPTMGPIDTREQQMSGTTAHGRHRAFVAGSLVAAVVAAVGGVVLLTGGDDKTDVMPTTAPPPPVTTSPAATPTVSTPPTPNDVAATAAETKFLQYIRVADQIKQGGYKSAKPYDAVAVSPARTQLSLETDKGKGLRTTGDTVVATLGVQSIKLSNDPKKAFSEVRLTGCLDVSGVKAFKADGSSALAATRLPRIAVSALMQMVPGSALRDGRPTGWYLAKLEYPGGGTAC